MNETKMYPLWKEAVKSLIEMCPEPGYLITHEWLDDQFGLSKGETIQDFEKYQLARLGHFDKFRGELLEEFQIALKSVPSKGYEIIPPCEQTQVAMSQLSKDLSKAWKNAISTTTNIKFEELSSRERQENTDARVKLAFMMSSVKKAKRLSVQGLNEIAG